MEFNILLKVLFRYMVLVILIGQVFLLLDEVQLIYEFYLEPILFIVALESSSLLLVPVLKQNTDI